jgi:hypothetical protein
VRSDVSGVSSAGFATLALPAASAGVTVRAQLDRVVPGRDVAGHAVRDPVGGREAALDGQLLCRDLVGDFAVEAEQPLGVPDVDTRLV